ncbi:MAG: hypothetical protein JSW48_03560 [Betaproteobacteria bacterium]|jgi:hypothetical protein|nr:MAG: hypothetical protein JSW48_03560 [Betaproteobacteria bacterium]
MGRTLSVLVLLAWLLSLTPAQAARDFPQDARRGTLNAHQYPNYRIGTTTYRLGAGGRIFNEQNLIVMPASLPDRKAEVMYRIDFQGYLSEIWLLTREEAALNPKQGNRPR